MTDLTHREALAFAALAGGVAFLGAGVAHAGSRDTLPRIRVMAA